MTPSEVLDHIKMRLGLSHNISPLSDEDIIKTINRETLKTFSKYYPYMFMMSIYEDRDQMLLLGDQKGVYFLKTGDLEVLNISSIYRVSQYLYDKWPIYNVDAFNYQMFSDLKSIVTIPSTFLFIPPNKIEVFPKFYTPSDFMIQVKCVHPTHLMSIPLALRDQFCELAVLDIKTALYPILKNYNGMNTAYATIDLKIDDYANSWDERKTLLSSWDERFYMEPTRRKIFIG